MAEMHSYAANSRRQAAILGVTAFAAAIAALLTHLAFRSIASGARQTFDLDAYAWLISPLTLTTYNSLLIAGVDKYLWRFFSSIPFLGGTWVGCTLPTYQTWPHLSVMKIEQTWSAMFVETTHFWKHEHDRQWTLAKQLGRDQSITAALSGRRVNEANFTFSYQHKGIRPTQSDFDGTMNLIFDLRGGRLQGKYYTNRPSLSDDARTSHGHVFLFKITDSLISSEEAFARFMENSELLSSTVAFVLDMAETGALADDARRVLIAGADERSTSGVSALREADVAERAHSDGSESG